MTSSPYRGIIGPAGDIAAASRRLGYVAVLLAAVGYGLMPVFVKQVYKLGIDPLTLVSSRYLFAAPFMWLALSVIQRGKITVPLRSWPVLFVLGVFIVSTQLALAFALKFLDASLVSVLFYTYPVFVGALSVLVFSESLNRFRGLSLVLVVAGGILVTQLNPFEPLQISLLGLSLALVASFSRAGYLLFTQSARSNCSPLVLGAVGVTFAALLLAFVRPPVYLFDGSIGQGTLLFLAALAIFCSAIPIFLLVFGVSLIGASNSAIVAMFEPVVTVGCAIIFLGEWLQPLQIAGMIAILAAVGLLQMQHRAEAVPTPVAQSGIGEPPVGF